MSTEYTYWIDVLAYDIPTANALARIIGAAPGDSSMFSTVATPCYDLGTTFSPVDPTNPQSPKVVTSAPVRARAIGVAAKASAAIPAQEFGTGGYPAVLTGAGYTHAQIDAMRTVVKVRVRARDDSINSMKQLVSDNGLTYAGM